MALPAQYGNKAHSACLHHRATSRCIARAAAFASAAAARGRASRRVSSKRACRCKPSLFIDLGRQLPLLISTLQNSRP